MPIFRFEIEAAKPYADSEGIELPSADHAWDEAVRFVRDIEGSLKPGERWRLTVLQDNEPIFRISIATEELRDRR